MLHTCLTRICCQFEKSIWQWNWLREYFFCNNLVNYKYITCSLLCFLYTCWMCLIQIWQKYIHSSTVGKHNFGYILCFVYQLSNYIAFVFLEGRGYVNFLLAAYRWLLKFSGCDAMWVIFFPFKLVILLILASSSWEDIVMMGITILHKINC